jgi:hypothetical protein
MNHPFFADLQNHPQLQPVCRTDNTSLPEAWTPVKDAKAIVLGADPTNDGVAGKRGLIELDYAFGIGHKHENSFWGAQKRNLTAIGLKKEEVYVQNICRNYFKDQTAKNKHWETVADLWIPYLKEELSIIPSHVPVLATAETIMKFLVGNVPEPKIIYQWEKPFSFYSKKLEREVLPFYRHPQYSLVKPTYPYKQYLVDRFKTVATK